MSRWDRAAEFLAPRLWLAWATGGILWLAWLGSVALGGGQYDRFGQLVCTDHLAFYSAAVMIREGRGGEIYDNATLAQRQIELVGETWRGKYEAYRNPPFYALMYVPTAGLPYVASAAIWTVISLVCLVGGVHLLGPERPWRTAEWVFCFYPTFCAISYGQNTALSFGFLALVYRLLEWSTRSASGRDSPPFEMIRSSEVALPARGASGLLFVAGAVAGLLCFKPTLLIGLAVWLVLDIKRLWPCAVGACVTVLLLCGVSYVIVPESWTAFLASLRDNASFDQMDWWKNLTPRAFWRLLLGDSPAVGPLAVTSSLVGIVWFVLLWRKKRHDLATMFGATVVLTLWASPHALIYEWTLLLIPAVLWWNHAAAKGRSKWTVLLTGFGILALVGPPLAQGQLKFLPFALHVSVLGFGCAAWLTGNWLTRPKSTA
jgi:alpha-1,2-mannosyltransferase